MPYGVLSNLTRFAYLWWSILRTIWPLRINKAVLDLSSWCSKGHILLCLEGELHTELDDGRSFTLTAGMSYQVADQAKAHRSSTSKRAKLFIVD